MFVIGLRDIIKNVDSIKPNQLKLDFKIDGLDKKKEEVKEGGVEG